MKKVKELSKKQKMLGIGISGLLILGMFVGGYTVYASSIHQKEIKNERKQIKKASNQLGEKNKELAMFYDDDFNFLVSNIDEKKVTTFEKSVRKLKNEDTEMKELSKEASDYNDELVELKEKTQLLSNKLQAQKSVNQLFFNEKEQAINGNQVNQDLAIVDTLDNETIQTVKKALYKKESTDKFQVAVNQLLESAESQVNQIEQAKQAVSKIFKDNKVVNTDKKNYDSAKSEVDKIKNDTIKKELAEQLTKVKQELDKKEKVAQEKKAQQEQQQATNSSQVNTKNETGQNQVTTSEQNATGTERQQDYNTPSNNTPSTPSSNGNGVTSNGSSNSGSNSTGTINGQNPNNGGTTSGGVINDIGDIPGVEIGNTPW